MSLESAQYIHELVATNPSQNDSKRQGDDHLRMIKRALQATLPNIQGAVQASHTTLNNLPADTNAIVAELLKHLVPVGTVLPYDIVNKPTLPAGWVLADGTNVPGYGVVPDLRNRFIYGWGAEAAGITGGAGSETTSEAGANTPTITVEEHVLSLAELPTSLLTYPGSPGSGIEQNQGGAAESYSDANTSGGAGHTHTATISTIPAHSHTVATIPPYMRMVYIVKVNAYAAP